MCYLFACSEQLYATVITLSLREYNLEALSDFPRHIVLVAESNSGQADCDVCIYLRKLGRICPNQLVFPGFRMAFTVVRIIIIIIITQLMNYLLNISYVLDTILSIYYTLFIK